MRAARRLLSATCFRETAQSALRGTGSALLPPIGFYYSLYHAIIAALYLEWRTEPPVLRRATHSLVSRRLKAQLVNAKLVSSSCSELFDRLRAFREYANYTVGGKLKSDEPYINAIEQVEHMYDETGQAMASILSFIRQVSNAAPIEPSLVERIAITIGDHIGEDVVQMYLAENDGSRVVKYLVAEGLST